MLTHAEKGYLALTLAFLATGSGIKAWRRATVRIGALPDPVTLAMDSTRMAADALRIHTDSSGESVTVPVNDSSSAALNAPITPIAPVGDGAVHPTPPAARKAAVPGKDPTPAKVDLNRATAEAFMRLPGVGEKTARLIVQYRSEHGPFRDARDLLQIKGIGEKKLEKLTPFLIL